MTQDDMVKVARECGIGLAYGRESIERFYTFVAAAEREALGDIILDYAERDDLSDSDESLLKHLFELIRARGET